MNINYNKTFSMPILYLCILTDIVFVALNVLYELHPAVTDPALQIAQDRGYSEIFQYIKEFWIAGTLMFFAWRRRSALYLAWSGLFFYLLLDDSLRIHENWSKAPYFPSLFGLNSHASGEIIIAAAVGISFLGLIAIAYRSAPPFERTVSKFLTWLLFSLAFLGVFIDGLHSIIQVTLLDPIFTTLEDGGEMLVMSLTLSFILLLTERVRQI